MMWITMQRWTRRPVDSDYTGRTLNLEPLTPWLSGTLQTGPFVSALKPNSKRDGRPRVDQRK
jgi:hypothetical protein